MFALRTPKDEPPPGLLVTEQQEPALWAAVRTLAEETGTRAPDEIVLTPDVNAAVAEGATFLGLKPGRRRMYIGLPLMAGLSEPQLRAVLAHEFGHYTNHDTRLSAITLRGRLQVLRTVASLHERSRKKVAKEEAKQEKKNAKRLAKGKTTGTVDAGTAGLSYRLAAKPFLWYGTFYLRASQGVGRRQELAATWPPRVSPAATPPRPRCARSPCWTRPTASTCSRTRPSAPAPDCCRRPARSSAGCAICWPGAPTSSTRCGRPCPRRSGRRTTPTLRSPSASPASSNFPTTAAP
ncbi:M48 family metallopeptidase [Streptomyces sp. NPDC008343]|uniref:M48 family metallopeptidase n=1 Tax=Streptomyces sp. NPDC008343 TaxID=3364828 RepID=UPI0036F01D12